MGRSEAEANARQAVEDTDREIPVGSAVVRRDRPESKHFLIRFPYQAVEDGDVEPGDKLDQYYDPETEELRIPLE
jgi:hypothetical protein